METKKALRIIISGGGTGGHIFPAISIANKMKELCPESEILFVGAEGKMEMEKVPAAGYRIIGLPIVGLQRKLTLHNIVNDLQAPFKVIASICKAGKIIREFKPDIAIGVGGYASAPLLMAADENVLFAGVKAVICEALLFHLLCRRHYFLADRIACHDYLVGREEPFHAFIWRSSSLTTAMMFSRQERISL